MLLHHHHHPHPHHHHHSLFCFISLCLLCYQWEVKWEHENAADSRVNIWTSLGKSCLPYHVHRPSAQLTLLSSIFTKPPRPPGPPGQPGPPESHGIPEPRRPPWSKIDQEDRIVYLVYFLSHFIYFILSYSWSVVNCWINSFPLTCSIQRGWMNGHFISSHVVGRPIQYKSNRVNF